MGFLLTDSVGFRISQGLPLCKRIIPYSAVASGEVMSAQLIVSLISESLVYNKSLKNTCSHCVTKIVLYVNWLQAGHGVTL